MTNKLLLIDGHNLLVQMFYGMPNKMEGKNGKSIEGIWGFTGALLKMISQTNPTHICVIFEKEETYYQWKEQENTEPEKNPFLILPDIKSVLEKLNISYFETEKLYKTSDYIKEYCNQYKESCEIIISSWDYNYISLVSSHINLLTYKGNNSIRYT